MQAEQFLKEHVAKMASLTDDEFTHFFSHFRPHCFKKGQVVIKEGDKVDVEYFVVSGCLKAFYINDDVKMHVLQFAMPTWWTSDYQALYTQTRATISVDCITDVKLLSLSHSDREKLCDEIHAVERFFRWRTNKGYVAAQRRLLSLMNNDAKARYEELLNLYPQLYTLVPKHLIAAYLGVTRETLASEKYPEARLEITGVLGNHIEGNLTIRGITGTVGFDVRVNVDGDTLTASGKVVVDRTIYGMKFRSGNFFKDLGDTLIYNDFDLDLNITAKAIA